MMVILNSSFPSLRAKRGNIGVVLGVLPPHSNSLPLGGESKSISPLPRRERTKVRVKTNK